MNIIKLVKTWSYPGLFLFLKVGDILYQIKLINGLEETIVQQPTPYDTFQHLTKININQKKSVADKLTFTIYPNNQGYNKLNDLITLIEIKDTRDSTKLFEGRVISSPSKMSNTGEFFKDVVCEGELAYLNDTKTRVWDLTGLTVRNALQLIIDSHNSRVEADKQFVLGIIDVTGILDCQTNFENSLNFILDKFVNKFGGVLRVRKEGNIRYLDYLGSIGLQNTQEIQLGVNMKDMIIDRDVTNVATRVIPVGKDNLTIETVNDGKDYLDDADSISQFGIIEQIADLKDIEDPNLLKLSGQEYLEQAKKAKYKLQITSVDLSFLNMNLESFSVGDDVKIINEVMNVNDFFTVIEKDIDLLEPWNSKLTIDNKFENLTDRQINMQRAANALDAVLTAQGKLNTYFLQGIIDTLKNRLLASGAYQHAKVLEDKGYLLENTDASSTDFGALYLGPGIFAIANSKVGGKWDFRTFGTGKGFVADCIVTGTLDANLVNVINLIADNIKTGTLNAKDVNIVNLNASNINTGELDANIVKVKNINADDINAGTLNGDIVKVINLIADNIKAGTLNGDNVNIINLSATNIKSGTLYGATINVVNLNADHINAGTLTVAAQWNTPSGTIYANSGSGLYNNFGGGFNAYKSLISVGTGAVSIADGEITVQLPAKFKNKIFSVIVAARTAVSNSGFTLWTNPESWNFSQGTFKVIGGSGDGTEVVDFSWTAVA
jgi:hypothetical protein